MTQRLTHETTTEYHTRLARRAPSIDCVDGVVSFHFGSGEEARAFYEAMTSRFEKLD